MWYLTLHRWVGDREEAVRNHLDSHLSWMHEQQVAGRVLIAGPTPDLEVGIIVFGHMSREDLDELCRHEPFVAAGHRQYEVIPWEVHHLLGIGGFDRRTVSAMAEHDARSQAGPSAVPEADRA